MALIRKIAKLKINGTHSLNADKRFMDKLAKCEIRLQALEYYLLKVISNDLKGISASGESNILKIRGSEIQQEITGNGARSAPEHFGVFYLEYKGNTKETKGKTGARSAPKNLRVYY